MFFRRLKLHNTFDSHHVVDALLDINAQRYIQSLDIDVTHVILSVLDAQYSVRQVRRPLIDAIRNYRALPGTYTALKAYDSLSLTKIALLCRLVQSCTT
jgi:hypothetical protein